jgi:hypothetical protein
MIWISIILSIIEAIPTIINIVKEILAAIKGHPANTLAFQQLLLKHSDFVDAQAAEAQLKAFHGQVVANSPFSPSAAQPAMGG